MTTQIEPEMLYRLITAADVKVVDASIEKQTVKVLDASWALDGTDMHGLFLQDHILGAQFFDIEAVSDHSTDLPHMAPSPEQFAEAVGALGIAASDHVVIYDRQGLFSAARAWWTFKLMGHAFVHVLRGGLPAWKTAGYPLSSKVTTPVATTYTPHPHPEKIISFDELRRHVDMQRDIILDARSKARFEGTAPEPRAGLRSGHMPGSRSLPFNELIQDGALKPRHELEVVFSVYGVAPNHTVITTCGSGVTAAIISMALEEIGHTQALLYDGSWSEWGQADRDAPVITGAV